MLKLLSAFVVALFLVATPAQAALFTLADFNVTVHEEDPGLVLFEKEILSTPTSFVLDLVGQSKTFTLFELGTKETALNPDDLKPYDIEVDFDFSTPLPGFGGAANGITGAGWFFGSFGYVAWDNPLLLQFGNYGLLGVTLENTTFGLPGSTKVDATFTLLRADGGTPTSVPEPASALLLGVGVVAMGAFRRQRRLFSR